MKRFVGLLKRELLEHPALYVGPLGVNLLIAVSALLLVARAIGSAENLRDIVGMIDLADPASLEAGRNALIASPIALVVVVTIAVGYFYFIDCLYAERRDRTILFFKSFPVTDTETVLSKLFCGIVVLPALSLIAFAITQVFVLIVASIAMAAAGGSPGSLWSFGAMVSNWLFIFYVLVTCAIWYSPFIAYFLFVSAWAKRAVLLWSLLPFLAMHAEWLLPGPAFLTPLVLDHIAGYPAAAFAMDVVVSSNDDGAMLDWLHSSALTPLTFADPGGFLSEAALWVGALIAALLVIGAIYLRRYRDDS